ncbi:MAG: anti-sigma factor family protein, partial [Gemmatimonadales bacterium]
MSDTMTDQWTDRLSDYLDGHLATAERAALEVHLPDCAACRSTLAELRRVVMRARTLEDRPPAGDLWPGIATRIAGRRAARWRRVSLN